MILPPAPFIVGMGRSGTTLLRLMIDSHPAIAIPPETQFISTLNLACDREEFITQLTTYRRWPDFHLDADVFAEAVRQFPDFSLTKGLRAFYQSYANRFNKPRWGDKTPIYAEHMQSIAELLPEAHFVHIIRDGRDSALSYRGLWFGPGSDFATHAEMWRRRILVARKQAADGDLRYIEVRYEALVTRPEDELRQICAFINVGFSPLMLEYHTRAKARIDELEARRAEGALPALSKDQHAGIFSRTFSPPDPGRIGLWRKEMTRSEQDGYAAVAGDLLAELGYL
jgi:hypothetical protein